MVVLAGTRSDRSVVEELARIETDKWERQRKEKLHCQMKELTGKDPREGQVVALYHLLYGEQDTLFQAATGYGKSMIWQCAPIIGKGIALMISPLNMLTEEQVALLPIGSSGIAITSQNNNDRTYAEIAAGKYTHGMSFMHILQWR